ncbi:hypothetical protein [Mumia zhuanghuii]|uniref:Uncharacterized protein n=1 Tax=Mumia zhuanghuii TaxID=2585211 RepID=A0A5C4LUV3_9ACTN|nr:hypothetical protein [Mumia zhuanghuii]TNC21764.1 hypothetical protein FHE65_36275 [Mumia zhuanghuii]
MAKPHLLGPSKPRAVVDASVPRLQQGHGQLLLPDAQLRNARSPRPRQYECGRVVKGWPQHDSPGAAARDRRTHPLPPEHELLLMLRLVAMLARGQGRDAPCDPLRQHMQPSQSFEERGRDAWPTEQQGGADVLGHESEFALQLDPLGQEPVEQERLDYPSPRYLAVDSCQAHAVAAAALRYQRRDRRAEGLRAQVPRRRPEVDQHCDGLL